MKRNNKICRVIAAMLITVMVTISLSGCGGKNTKSSIPSGTAANEILTLSPVAQAKELVTIHYEYGLNIARALEQTIETQFPNVDIVMVHDGGYTGFLFRDKNGMPEVAMHWEHRFNHAVHRYNEIFRIQMPNITPHVCRHTYCSNQA